MSYDQVKFNLADTDAQRVANINAAEKAFGISRGTATRIFDMHGLIVCRPSQFARFIIYRSEHIQTNRIAQLGAVLFTPGDDRTPPLDVSKNKHDGCSDE